MILSREDLLEAARKAADIPRESLHVPELGGDVWVRGMSGRERDRFEEALRIRKGRRAGQTNLLNYRAKLAVQCLMNAEGERLMTDADADALGQLPVGVLDRIAQKVNELSGRDAEEMDDLGNDSGSPAASGGSTSSSPSN